MTHSQAQAEEVKDSESRPLASIPLAIATLLAILGSTAHIATLLLTPGYLVSTGGRSLSDHLSSPGLTAAHGPAQARSLTHSQAQAEVKDSKSQPLAIATLVAILGSAGATLLVTPGYPVSTGG